MTSYQAPIKSASFFFLYYYNEYKTNKIEQ